MSKELDLIAIAVESIKNDDLITLDTVLAKMPVEDFGARTVVMRVVPYIEDVQHMRICIIQDDKSPSRLC